MTEPTVFVAFNSWPRPDEEISDLDRFRAELVRVFMKRVPSGDPFIIPLNCGCYKLTARPATLSLGPWYLAILPIPSSVKQSRSR